ILFSLSPLPSFYPPFFQKNFPQPIKIFQDNRNNNQIFLVLHFVLTFSLSLVLSLKTSAPPTKILQDSKNCIQKKTPHAKATLTHPPRQLNLTIPFIALNAMSHWYSLCIRNIILTILAIIANYSPELTQIATLPTLGSNTLSICTLIKLKQEQSILKINFFGKMLLKKIKQCGATKIKDLAAQDC